MSFCDEARAGADDVWGALVEHPFVRGMADATLPPESFRFYLTQNVQYLAEYARVLAIGLAKTTDETTLVRFSEAVTNITHVELPQNHALLEKVRELCTLPPEPVEEEPAPGLVAYSSWLLSTAYRGGAIDVLTAALPCAWSYGDIGRAHAPHLVMHPVYENWIAFFASPEYDAMLQGLKAELDARVARCDGPERQRLAGVFRTACLLERGFWDMAWNRARF
ncbi:thiaminase II [Kineosporia sp. NBRC 101731]|uniref:thiaminase II n=1 Tax=Kineosporia sp. NBRC 101731 TaxID=3032199 RepID=UPI0024A5F3BF|nr:thiaminase II [Kineosporia sp. NBRC 101731]GLY30971.1 thiaminase II [Kineosporia sp. NBRC 101731]